MNGREPDRLGVVGASELERRLLTAAGAELPDPELRARMARAIGLAGFAAGATATAGAAVNGPAASGSLPWPVISASIAALALTGAAIGYASHQPGRAMPPAATAPAIVRPMLQPATAPDLAPAPAATSQATARPAASARRRPAPAASQAGDLRVEIALLDAARAAVAEGNDARALALLRRYDTRYPRGTFRPESTALRIEALAGLGEMRQARALGAVFLAAHADSPLAARVRNALGDPAR